MRRVTLSGSLLTVLLTVLPTAVALLAVPPGVAAASDSDGRADPGRRAAWVYSYSEAYSQYATANGAGARFSVHKPKQIPRGGDHSLAEIAIRPGDSGHIIEAGWTVEAGRGVRLFVFWWKNDNPRCYNFGCGFVDRGPGIRPGTRLKPGTSIDLAWRHTNGKWWLIVNGKRSGFYRDRQWNGQFEKAGLIQVFGEVVHRRGERLCHDMGNGLPASNRRAARISDVRFLGGPDVQLTRGRVDRHNRYTFAMTSPTSFRYGGRGLC